MMRTALAIIGGIATWAVTAILLDFVIRAAIPGYHAAEPTFAFTLPMLIARLALAVAASLAAGFVVRTIAPASRYAPWILAAILLAVFVPGHIMIWAHFPLWYHLFFLLTVAPLIALGARMKSAVPRG